MNSLEFIRKIDEYTKECIDISSGHNILMRMNESDGLFKHMDELEERLKNKIEIEGYDTVYYKVAHIHSLYIYEKGTDFSNKITIEYNDKTGVGIIFRTSLSSDTVLLIDIPKIHLYERLITEYFDISIKILEYFKDKCLMITTKNDYKLML